MKRLLRFLLVLAAVAAIALLVRRARSHSPAPAPAAVPAVEAAPEPSAAPATPAGAPADGRPAAEDLAEIWGIGPVFRTRLAEAGIITFASLAGADPTVVAAATGVPEVRAAGWIAEAAARLAP